MVTLRERYTKLRLVAAFLQTTTGLFAAATDVAKGVSNAQRMLVAQLDAKAAAVNGFLAKKNDADPNTAHAGSSIHTSVDQLIALMRNMLLWNNRTELPNGTCMFGSSRRGAL